MADPNQVEIIRNGVDAWNAWRHAHPGVEVDLSGANLSETHLTGIDLSRANLYGADLAYGWFAHANFNSADMTRVEARNADFMEADLRGARLCNATLAEAHMPKARMSGATLTGINLNKADLQDVDFSGSMMSAAMLRLATVFRANLSACDLSGADLSEAKLNGVNFRHARLSGAFLIETDLSCTDFTGADLRGAQIWKALFVETRLNGADLTGARIFGIAAWDVQSDEATVQRGLIITPAFTPEITVDELEVAQFIYLLLNRKKLRNVLDTITSKAVLLLGRFTAERKALLDALADELRKHNLLPIIFDFERSTNRDFTETIKILAGLSLFVIVDITKPKSAPQELTATVPDYQIPFVPILEEGEEPYSMFVDFKKYDWVLKPVLRYRTKQELLDNFRTVILDRAWGKHIELQRKKTEQLETVSIEDILNGK